MRTTKVIAAAAFALLVVAACSSSGGLGDIYGTNNNNRYDIRGTVDSVDLNSRSIWLTNSSGYNSSLASGGSGGGNVMTVSYDTNARVDSNGQLYPVTNLERGDVVEVQVANNGASSYFAQSIVLVRDVNR